MAQAFTVIAYILYFVIGLVQIGAMFAYFTDYMEWGTFVSLIVGGIVAYIPLLGNILGAYASVHCWGWSWIVAIPVFFCPFIIIIIPIVLGCLFEKVGSLFESKEKSTYSNTSSTNHMSNVEQTSVIAAKPVDTKPVIEQSINNTTSTTVNSLDSVKKEGFFTKLIQGDYSLASTFWLYGLLAFLVLSAIGAFLVKEIGRSGGFAICIGFGMFKLAYVICVYIGTWRAATKYQGPKAWAVIAKIIVAIGWIELGLSTLQFVRLICR